MQNVSNELKIKENVGASITPRISVAPMMDWQ